MLIPKLWTTGSMSYGVSLKFLVYFSYYEIVGFCLSSVVSETHIDYSYFVLGRVLNFNKARMT